MLLLLEQVCRLLLLWYRQPWGQRLLLELLLPVWQLLHRQLRILLRKQLLQVLLLLLAPCKICRTHHC